MTQAGSKNEAVY